MGKGFGNIVVAGMSKSKVGTDNRHFVFMLSMRVFENFESMYITQLYICNYARYNLLLVQWVACLPLDSEVTGAGPT